MPFEELETITRANAPPMATISYSLAYKGSKRPDKGDRKPRLLITIPTTLCGASKSETFRLLIGTGPDAGKLMIKGDNVSRDGGVSPTQLAHFFRWNFGFVPRLGDDMFEGEKRPVRKISEEEFEISVPVSWFEADVEEIPSILKKTKVA
jgi:hypothetical protein